jgi:hypothetical protein
VKVVSNGVSWDAALADVASRMKEIIQEHGPTAILPYSYIGTEGIIQGGSIDRRQYALALAHELAVRTPEPVIDD